MNWKELWDDFYNEEYFAALDDDTSERGADLLAREYADRMVAERRAAAEK